MLIIAQLACCILNCIIQTLLIPYFAVMGYKMSIIFARGDRSYSRKLISYVLICGFLALFQMIMLLLDPALELI